MFEQFQKFDFYPILAKAVAEELVERLQYMKLLPQTILDVGSGMGFVSEALAKTKLSAVYTIQVDFALDLLRQASSLSKVCVDTYKLPIKTHSIDVLLSNLCLPFVDDIYAVFDEWQRVLKPGGLCLFSSLGPDTLKELKQDAIYKFLDMHDVGDALLATGFAEPVMDVDTITLHYDSIDELQEGESSVTFEVIYGCAWATNVIPNKRIGNEVHVPMQILKRK